MRVSRVRFFFRFLTPKGRLHLCVISFIVDKHQNRPIQANKQINKAIIFHSFAHNPTDGLFSSKFGTGVRLVTIFFKDF